MYSRSITPICHGPFVQVKGMHNGLDRASIAEERYDNHNEIPWFTQTLEHGSPAGAERSSAPLAPCHPKTFRLWAVCLAANLAKSHTSHAA
jgi:hypothetical protein